MDEPNSCPDRVVWERFLAEELEDPQRTGLEAHLDDCESCREVLALLAEWPSAAVWSSSDRCGCASRFAESQKSETAVAAVAPPDLPGLDQLVEIGRGGMGVVYRAHQIGLDRPVAVKVLSTAAAWAPHAQVRAARESKALARLNHPNIVRIYSVGESDGLPYIVMEWIDGGDLGDRLASGPLPAREAASLVRSVALAVAAAHERGVIHRDIKPRNILLGEDSSPRLTDFGLALEHDSNERLTLSGFALGTPGYMAPEQIESSLGAVGPSADIYALGATLFAMLVGRPPFQAGSHVELFRRIVECDPESPRRLNDSIPVDLDTICLKCLDKRPDRRYASANDLAAELGRFLDGLPIQARPISAIGKFWRQAKRHPAITALAAAVCVLLMALGLTGVLSVREQTRLRKIAENQTQLALEREAIVRANADRAWQLLRTMAEGLEASSRAFDLLNSSSEPVVSSDRIAPHIREVAAVYADYFRDRPVATPWTDFEVQMLGALAQLREQQGNAEDAERLRRRCIHVGLPLLEAAPDDVRLRQFLADLATKLAVAQVTHNPLPTCLADFERAYRIAEGMEPEDIERADQSYTRSMATTNLALTYHQLERFAEAAAIQAEGIEFARKVLDIRPGDAALEAQLIEHLCGLAMEQNELDQPKEAARLLDEVEARLERLSNESDTHPARDLPTLRNWMLQERESLAKRM